MNVPLLDLSAQIEMLRPKLEAAFSRCLQHRGFCLGPEVERFETEFARWSDVPYCIGLNSGTSALHLALRLLEIGPGDEVIVPAMTFASTAWSVSYVGATPVFADVEAEHFTLDPASVRDLITPRTRAMIPVHLFGQAADMDPLMQIASEHGLAVVEDAAQAHGATYKGTPVGRIASLSAFSFYPGKNLGACGEAGALCTTESAFDKRARSLRSHGSTVRYYHDEVGYNYRMEGLQAAALNVKMEFIDQWTERRRAIARFYQQNLSGLPLHLPMERPGCKHVWHLFTTRFEQRDELARYLTQCGVETGRHYPVPLHRQKCYAETSGAKHNLPVSEAMAEQCLSLPLFPELTDAQLDHVCDSIHRYFSR